MYRKYQSQPKVYPEDIECVIDPIKGKGAVYIGNLQASQNLRTLRSMILFYSEHGIGAVLTAAKSIHLNHPKTHVPYHLHIPGEDHQRFDLSVYFETAANFIESTRQKTNILIHCMAGVSRSVTLLLAYLIKNKQMSFNDAYNMIKRRRKIINPNRGFLRQLQEYERNMKNNEKIYNNQGAEYENQYGYRIKLQGFNPQRYDELSNRQDLSQRANKLWNQIWPSNRQAYPHYSHHSNYYNNVLRKNKGGFNHLNQKYQDHHTIDNPKGINDNVPYLQNFRTEQAKYKSSNQSFEELNKELDQRITEIRQKYSDLAEKTANYSRKGMLNQKESPYQNYNETISYQRGDVRKSMSTAGRPLSYAKQLQKLKHDYDRDNNFTRGFSARNNFMPESKLIPRNRNSFGRRYYDY